MTSPSRHLHHRLVVGFHGCDKSVAEHVLLQQGSLTPSENQYDWLGSGIYFWEHSEQRAWEWAREQQARGKVTVPFVIGAYINLGRSFDLTDTARTAQLAEFYADYVEAMQEVGRPLATNRRPSGDGHDLLLRELDCAVLNLGLENLDETEGSGACFYQTVRGVFVEGPPAYEGATIRTKTHIQISVRDPACILGYFLPAGYNADEDGS